MSVSSATEKSVGLSSGISLREVFPEAMFVHADDIRVSKCVSSLAECRNNDLFVALLGPVDDGHEDAVQAIRRGAMAVVSERLLPIDAPQCIVEDSRIAFGTIKHTLADQPCLKMQTVGVAGTDGKSTTSHLIASILETAGKSTGLHSSIPGSSIPDTSAAKGEPSKTDFTKSLARMVLAGKRMSVIEANSVALAQHQYAGMKLDVAVINNLRGNHFGFHSTLQNYRRAQLRLLDYLKPTGVAVINADDPGCHFALETIKTPTLTFGIKQQADVTARIIESDLYETTFVITAGNDSAMVRTQLPGRHHVYNCLAATAAALLFGVDLQTIARGLEKIQSLPGRMNVVKCGQKFALAIDEAASPYRLGVALNTLQQNTTGKVYCVFSTPFDADTRTASQFGRIAERHSAIPVITRPTANGSVNLGERIEYEPIHQVLDGFDRPAKARTMPDRIAAIEWALAQAKPGDAVLIAGRGDQPIAQLSEGRWELSDMEVCQSWLYGDSVPGETIPTTVTPPAIFKIDDYRIC